MSSSSDDDCDQGSHTSSWRKVFRGRGGRALSKSGSPGGAKVQGVDAPFSASASTACVQDPLTKILSALGKLQDDVRQLKTVTGLVGGGERVEAPITPSCSGLVPEGTTVGGRTEQVTKPPLSTEEFSGFRSPDESMEDGELREESVLLQAAKALGPTEVFSDGIEEPIANMINHLFVQGMKADDYKDILEEDFTKCPNNCQALLPVECNTQVLDALPTEAKKSDFRLQGVCKDITKAATILVKSLTVLDKLAGEVGNPLIAEEVAKLNGALALLGNANSRTNLTRRHLIKRDINHKYAHLCSDRAPMTKWLFGDDLSQAAKQIEEAAKLKLKISTKKPFRYWTPGSWRFRGIKQSNFSGSSPFRGLSSRFHPYVPRKTGNGGSQRPYHPRTSSSSKNLRGRGSNNPRR